MKISLITSTFNSASTLQETIDSVRSQDDGVDLEYIIVDGASNDATLSILDNNREIITHQVSEPDRGIYDALNKGIALATGEIVGILHSDDVFADSAVLARVAEAFQKSSIDAVYGDLEYVDRLNVDRVIRQWKSSDFDPNNFYQGWMPAHPTFYLRRKYYDQFGSFDLDFFTAADYELMLRMLLKYQLKAEYIPYTLVKMRVGGQSNATLKNHWIANKEDARAWTKNDLKPKFYTRWLKPISKLSQWIKV
jgi:glycosyltransferase involved in cell wall biosynthesis